MAIIVNTNMSSLIAQRNLTNATNGLNIALQRMSTGYKVNKAADDAAGMFIATNLETQIRGSKVAQTNVKTGTNLLQIAEGDIELLEDNLLRMRDLAVQAANSVYSDESMQAMADEVQYRAEEITRVATASQFNGLHLLDGTGLPDGLRLQVGPNADENKTQWWLTLPYLRQRMLILCWAEMLQTQLLLLLKMQRTLRHSLKRLILRFWT